MWEKMKQRRDVEFHPLSGFIIKLQGQTQGKNARDAHKPTLYIQMFRARINAHTDVACMYAKKGCQTNLRSLHLSHFLSRTHTHTRQHSQKEI